MIVDRYFYQPSFQERDRLTIEKLKAKFSKDYQTKGFTEVISLAVYIEDKYNWR